MYGFTVHIQPSAQHNLQLRLYPSSIGTRFSFMQSCPCICDAVSMHMCEVRYLSATCERAVREDVDATPARGGAGRRVSRVSHATHGVGASSSSLCASRVATDGARHVCERLNALKSRDLITTRIERNAEKSAKPPSKCARTRVRTPYALHRSTHDITQRETTRRATSRQRDTGPGTINERRGAPLKSTSSSLRAPSTCPVVRASLQQPAGRGARARAWRSLAGRFG